MFPEPNIQLWEIDNAQVQMRPKFREERAARYSTSDETYRRCFYDLIQCPVRPRREFQNKVERCLKMVKERAARYVTSDETYRWCVDDRNQCPVPPRREIQNKVERWLEMVKERGVSDGGEASEVLETSDASENSDSENKDTAEEDERSFESREFVTSTLIKIPDGPLIKPHVCLICFERFSYKICLVRHYKEDHTCRTCFNILINRNDRHACRKKMSPAIYALDTRFSEQFGVSSGR